MTETSARRRQVIALVLAGIFPGLGQLYNREWLKGAAFFGAGAVLSWRLGRMLPGDLLPWLEAGLLVPLGLLLAVWLWSLVDAWRVAGR
jgi:hypothetical protein